MASKVSLFLVTFFAFFPQLGLPLETAESFRQEIEATPDLTLLSDYINPLREEIKLPMSEVYNQKGTLWCWAYATFHSLRTYYYNIAPTTAASNEWKNALETLDSPTGFRAFMSEHFATNQLGYPLMFVSIFEKEKQLPSTGWVAYLAGKRDGEIRFPVKPDQGEAISTETLIEKLHTALTQNVASSFCNHVHCVSLFGGVYVDDKPVKYWIADSLSGIYQADPQKLHRKFLELATKL